MPFLLVKWVAFELLHVINDGTYESLKVARNSFFVKIKQQPIFVYTVNIWGQSEGIEKAILPSVGIFTCNLNVLIVYKTVYVKI